jgi:hypothetical protein
MAWVMICFPLIYGGPDRGDSLQPPAALGCCSDYAVVHLAIGLVCPGPGRT